MALSLQLAWRFSRSRGVEGFISVMNWFSILGVIVGVAALVIVMAVMEGFQREIVSKITDLNGDYSAYVIPAAYEDGPLQAVQIASALEEIDRANLFVDLQGLVSKDQASAGALIRGILPQQFPNSFIAASLIEGRDQLKPNSIVLGARMAHSLGAILGDKLTILVAQQDEDGRQLQPLRRGLEVTGLFEVGFHRFDNAVAFIPEAVASDLSLGQSNLWTLEIHQNAQTKPTAVKAAVRDKLPGLNAFQDWQAANASFLRVVEAQKRLLFLILSFIVIVAAFNIIASQVMLVNEKAKNIAILRTMGASRTTILLTFLIMGGLIGILGSIIGLVSGIGVALNLETLRQGLQSLLGIQLFPSEIYFLAELPVYPTLAETSLIFVSSFSLCLIASLYPAWRAAGLDPAEVLRNDL